QRLRHWSLVGLSCARWASGTLLETHPSYLAMKSSHSGTPIFSPLDAVVVVVPVVAAVLGLLELPAAVLLFSVVSVLLHPTKMAAHRTAKINKVLFNIGYSFKVQQ